MQQAYFWTNLHICRHRGDVHGQRHRNIVVQTSGRADDINMMLIMTMVGGLKLDT